MQFCCLLLYCVVVFFILCPFLSLLCLSGIQHSTPPISSDFDVQKTCWCACVLWLQLYIQNVFRLTKLVEMALTVTI